MITLEPEEYNAVGCLLGALRYYSPIAWSVVEGRQQGTVAVDERSDPKLVLIRGANRYCYLAGDLDRDPLTALETLDEGRPGVTVCVEHPGWADDLVNQFGDAAHPVQILTHRQEGYPASLAAWPSQVPSSCSIAQVDGAPFDRIADEFSLVPKVLWPDKDGFLREGLGYCLLEGDTIASLCFAGFVGGGACDITVMTDDNFRRRGYARLVAAALVNAWTQKGGVPQWHTTADNAASLSIAAGLGFRCTGQFPIVEVNR